MTRIKITESQLKMIKEVYYDSRKSVRGYVDANDLVGQRLWFHTNRTHRNQEKNGMVGIYQADENGKKTGLAGMYTNEVRLVEPIHFQTSESGAKSIQKSFETGENRRVLIAGVSGVVTETSDDITDMVEITYNPFDVGYFHEINDPEKKEIVSASEVYFNATEDGEWDIYVKNPVYQTDYPESL